MFKQEVLVCYIEFVSFVLDCVLVVLVFVDGWVENWVFILSFGYIVSLMCEVVNFLNVFVEGCMLGDLCYGILCEIEVSWQKLDQMVVVLIVLGLVMWDSDGLDLWLIVCGWVNFLVYELVDLDRVCVLFDDLECKCDIVEFLEFVEQGDGVCIFIGLENKFFLFFGLFLVVLFYMNVD